MRGIRITGEHATAGRAVIEHSGGWLTSRPVRVGVAVVGSAGLAFVANLNLSKDAEPNPFGSLERVLAALPAGMEWSRSANGEIIRPVSLRRIVTMDRFTGDPAELDPFLTYLSGVKIPDAVPGTEHYAEIERSELANGLRAIARAWPQADFSERFDDVLRQALRYARHPDALVESQAGLVLLALEPDLRAGEKPSEAARVMLAVGGKFCCEFREDWMGVIEHARTVAGVVPDASALQRPDPVGRALRREGEITP